LQRGLFLTKEMIEERSKVGYFEGSSSTDRSRTIVKEDGKILLKQNIKLQSAVSKDTFIRDDLESKIKEKIVVKEVKRLEILATKNAINELNFDYSLTEFTTLEEMRNKINKNKERLQNMHKNLAKALNISQERLLQTSFTPNLDSLNLTKLQIFEEKDQNSLLRENIAKYDKIVKELLREEQKLKEKHKRERILLRDEILTLDRELETLQKTSTKRLMPTNKSQKNSDLDTSSSPKKLSLFSPSSKTQFLQKQPNSQIIFNKLLFFDGNIDKQKRDNREKIRNLLRDRKNGGNGVNSDGIWRSRVVSREEVRAVGYRMAVFLRIKQISLKEAVDIYKEFVQNETNETDEMPNQAVIL